MKKLLFMLLLWAPIPTMAQQNFIGKSRDQVEDHFKQANIPLYITDDRGSLISDEYKTGSGPDITCFFDKTNICTKELDVVQFSGMAKIKANLERDWVNTDENIWVNKAKTVKVRLTGMEALGQLYVVYVVFGKNF